MCGGKGSCFRDEVVGVGDLRRTDKGVGPEMNTLRKGRKGCSSREKEVNREGPVGSFILEKGWRLEVSGGTDQESHTY